MCKTLFTALMATMASAAIRPGNEGYGWCRQWHYPEDVYRWSEAPAPLPLMNSLGSVLVREFDSDEIINGIVGMAIAMENLLPE